MKQSYAVKVWKSILFILMLVVLNNVPMAQVPSDTTKPATAMPADTVKPAPAAAATTTPPPANDKPKPKQFNVFAGINSNTMSGSTAAYNANSAVGYQIGVSWKKGGFTYWQVGLTYNDAAYGFNSVATTKDTGDLKVQALDIPITFGVNFLSFAKIVSLRAYLSAMPSFTLGVSSNHFGITKDDVNSFIFYGQGGIGVDVLFLMLDLGYNYGTQSLMKNSVNSTNPGQWFVNLGFRF